jgi:hypothetical protein
MSSDYEKCKKRFPNSGKALFTSAISIDTLGEDGIVGVGAEGDIKR